MTIVKLDAPRVETQTDTALGDDTVGFGLSDEVWEAYEIEPATQVAVGEFQLPSSELTSMFARIVCGEEKPANLTKAEEIQWDIMAAEVAAAPPDTQWRIPG